MILQELEGLEHSVTANKSEVTQRACICREFSVSKAQSSTRECDPKLSWSL